MMAMNYDYFEERPQDPVLEHRRRVKYQMAIRRNLRNTTDPFAISMTEFVCLYRMPQHVLLDFVEIIRPFVQVRRSKLQIPLEIKVLAAVGFFAVGSYQRPHGRIVDLNLSQSTMSNCIHEINEVLNKPEVLSQFIEFPLSREDREDTIRRNERLGLPRVLGFIDGTLVRIVPPPKMEHQQTYRSRKGFTALNVQIVCDASLYIMNVNSQFPGSTNDPYIYRVSLIRNEVMRAYRESHCWLLGDSAYPLEPWLMLPIPHAERGTPEMSYTLLHCHCRNAVERCIGLLKARWRCLLVDRVLHYKPLKAGFVVNACVVLHNFLLNLKAPQPVFENLDNCLPEPVLEEDLPLIQQANAVRQYLINHAHARRNHLHEDD